MADVQTVTTEGVIDISTPAFARRFGALVRERRLATGDSLRSIARGSTGALSVALLRQIEAAEVPLDDELISLVASRYGADLAAILPERLSIAVSADGLICSGPAQRSFVPGDETSLLTAYLTLVRSLRRERDTTIVLRRSDIDVLAAHLQRPGSEVVDRLLAIMGSTRAQRSAVLALFATGAMVIGLASSVSAVAGPSTVSPAVPASTTVVVQRSVTALDTRSDTGRPTAATTPVGPTAGDAEQVESTDDPVGVTRGTPVIDLGAGSTVSPTQPRVEPVGPPAAVDVGNAPVPSVATAPAPPVVDTTPPPPPPPPPVIVPPTLPEETVPDVDTGGPPLPPEPGSD